MIKHFKPYADILRQLGNFRHSYVIFVTDDAAKLIVKSQLLSNLKFKEISDKSVNIETLLTTVTSDDPVIIYRISDIRKLISNPEILLLANELQFTKHEFDVIGEYISNFKITKHTNDYVILNNRVLSYNNNLILQAPKKFTVSNVQCEPWHVLLYDESMMLLMLIIWDTREIVALEVLDDSKTSEIKNFKHVNDSSRLLYIWNNLYETLPEILKSHLSNNYIANIIDLY